jgi:Fic family protein
VIGAMQFFRSRVKTSIRELDLIHSAAASTPGKRLFLTVRVVAAAFQTFLTTHPFLDGNGHAGRFICWAIFARYGYRPVRWTIDPRPGFPDYVNLIDRHRTGDVAPLEDRLMMCIVDAA